jgi:hypothetical protein
MRRVLQDTVELKLTTNPDYTPMEAGHDTALMLTTAQKGEFTCPVTGLDTNGRNRFVRACPRWPADTVGHSALSWLC